MLLSAYLLLPTFAQHLACHITSPNSRDFPRMTHTCENSSKQNKPKLSGATPSLAEDSSLPVLKIKKNNKTHKHAQKFLMDWGLFYLCTCDSSTHHHTHDEQIIEISTYSSSIFHPSIEPCWAHTLQTGQKRPTTHSFPPALPSWLVYTHVSGDQRRQTSSSSSHLKAQRNLVQDSWQMALEKFMRLPTSPRAARDDPAGDTPASHHLQPSMLRAYSCL